MDTATDTPTEIADAAITVLAKQGLEAASIRNVAKETGVAPGTVQYHVGTRAQLLSLTLQRCRERQLSRVQEAGTGQLRALEHAGFTAEHSPLTALVRALSQLFPLDKASTAEAAVILALTESARHHSELAAHQREGRRALAAEVAGLLRQAREVGEVPSDLKLKRCARQLVALAEGLTLRLLITHPGEPGWSQEVRRAQRELRRGVRALSGAEL